MGKPRRTDSCSSMPRKMGECWGDSGVSTTKLLYKISTGHYEFAWNSTDKMTTFVILLLSSSGPNLRTLTATFLPLKSRFQRSVYPRVAKGISSFVLKSLLIRQVVGNLPKAPHSRRSIVNAALLSSAAMSGCCRIYGESISFVGLSQFQNMGDTPSALSSQ
jgi:hypothetical protein